MPFALVRKLSKFLNQEFSLVNDLKKNESNAVFTFSCFRQWDTLKVFGDYVKQLFLFDVHIK